MKFIENRQTYKDFNLLLESKFYISNSLRKRLEEIGDGISKELLNLEFKDTGKDLTFIDIDLENDKLFTFSRMDKLKSTNKKFFGKNIDNLERPHLQSFWKAKKNDLLDKDFEKSFQKSRNAIKIGKFINKILPNKFSDSEIESFVNSIKGINAQQKTEFKIVDGEKIIDYYLCDVKDGSLGNSCMQREDRVKREFFELYSKNKSCRLLVLLGEDGSFLGRSLIWEIDDFIDGRDTEDFDYYMDKVYVAHDKYYKTFWDYADKKGWGRRADTSIFNTTRVNFRGEVNKIKMSIKVDHIPERFPYMDTFKCLDFEEMELYNFDTKDNEDLWLEETDGSVYTTSVRADVGSHKGKYIRLQDAVSVEDGYIHVDDLKEKYRNK